MHVLTIVDKIKEKLEAPHLSGQWERKGEWGCWGVPVGGVCVGSVGLYLCWFWLKHWQ